VRYTKLGTTGLDISPIAIGAITYGQPDHGFPVCSLDEETSRPLIHHALEADIQVSLRGRTMVPTTDHQDAHKQPTRTELR
jgi:hypothetical protein